MIKIRTNLIFFSLLTPAVKKGCACLVDSFIKQLLPSLYTLLKSQIQRWIIHGPASLWFTIKKERSKKATRHVQSLMRNRVPRLWQWPTSVHLPIRLCHLSLYETLAVTPFPRLLLVWMTLEIVWNLMLGRVPLEWLVCTSVLQIEFHKPLIIFSYQAA